MGIIYLYKTWLVAKVLALKFERFKGYSASKKQKNSENEQATGKRIWRKYCREKSLVLGTNKFYGRSLGRE
jgi:hypothetical protein